MIFELEFLYVHGRLGLKDEDTGQGQGLVALSLSTTQCYLPPIRGDVLYSIKRPRTDARLSWPSWLVTYRGGI